MKNVLLVLSRECSHAGQFRARVSASAIGNVDIPFPLNLFKYARSSQDHQLDLVRLPLEALVPEKRAEPLLYGFQMLVTPSNFCAL